MNAVRVSQRAAAYEVHAKRDDIFFTFAPTFTDTMTRHKHPYILLFLLAAFFTACKPPVDPKAQLHKAEQSIETNPEAALASLDSILNPDLSLRHADHIKYILLHAEAAYLSFKEVKNDTAIFEACRYYEKKQDLPQLTKATLYSACVLEAQGQTDAAVDAYNKAFALASQNADSVLMARAKHYLGTLNYKTGYFEEALQSYKIATALYSHDLARKAMMYRAIGQTFALQHENDSALHYLEKGLEMAKKAGNVAEESKLLNAMSIVCREKGDFVQSLSLLRQSVTVGLADNDSTRLHLNYGKLFLSMNEMDSAGCYAELLQREVESVTDRPEQAAIYAFLSNYEAQVGDMGKAFLYQKDLFELSSSIYEENVKQSVYEAQQKYDYVRLQNVMNGKIIQRQRIAIYAIFALVFAVCIIAWLLLRNKKMKEAEQQVKSEMQALLNKTEDKDSILSDQLNWRLDLIVSLGKKAGKQINSRNELERLQNEIFCAKETPFEAVAAVLEQSYPSLYASIREGYPQMTETETKVCLLSCTDLSNADISSILDVSIHTVNKCRSSIRDKMNLETKGLKEQLQRELLEKNNP